MARVFRENILSIPKVTMDTMIAQSACPAGRQAQSLIVLCDPRRSARYGYDTNKWFD